MKTWKGMLCLGLLLVSSNAFASPVLSHLPEVKVPITSPSYNLVEKQGGFGAQMYWSEEPHTRNMNHVFVSATIKDTALNVDDAENLVYSLTDSIDKGMRIVDVQKTPYIQLKEKGKTMSDLSSEIQKYDAGLLFYIDKQTDGEIGLHVFLRDTYTGKVFGHYTARIDYNVDKGLEAKQEALSRGITEFAREFKRFRNGNREVSETIYQLH